MMRFHFRDGKEWAQEGLLLSTTSDQACKLFDSALTQYIGWYDDDAFGGLEKTLKDIKVADPEFVMGHVMSIGLDLIGTGRTPRLDNTFKLEIENVESLSKNQASFLTSREQSHVKAVFLWADGFLDEAINVWEDILVNYPTDIFALKMAHDTYFYLGYQSQIRDSIARVLPHWKPTIPLYSYLYGMYAFGLEETNFYSKAEEISQKGLELNPRDAWATHALAHVFEMEGRANEGIAFLSSTVKNWEPSNLLACHNFWHWALYHIEKGEFEAALDIFDTQVGKRVHSGSLLDIIDANSLLYRLELEGAQVKDKWQEVFEICCTHIEDHVLAFNDAHIFMSCLRAKNENAKMQLMNSLDEFVRKCKGINSRVSAKVGNKIIQALLAYDEERYEDVVSLLHPIRYEIVEIGGSNAQSANRYHHSLARSLLYERKSLKEVSGLTDRLMARALASHNT
ncbi:tetratricopeptide repeat protein 38-like isoform X2 [Tachypleus tridentatus]|uniref:tetratricopeptide repeat protein 38-like isoform X2 n=1 Tax=Tachypleus tridentatus TaxID=6853 RepID=UPI003FD43BDB